MENRNPLNADVEKAPKKGTAERGFCGIGGGRTVRYTLKMREGQPHYFIVFRHPDQRRRRIERSTHEANKKRAHERAAEVINEAIDPARSNRPVGWDEAVKRLEKELVEKNDREKTIKDYLDTIEMFKRICPESSGPADVTIDLAKKFKTRYRDEGYTRRKPSIPKPWTGRGRKPKPPIEPKVYFRSPKTVASRLNKLRVIWSCWFVKELGFVSENPWESVTVPRTDKPAPRHLKPEEIVAFFAWLTARWQGWRLPQLFFEVKAFLGNRISQLCSLRSDQLDSGRVVFPADEAKGRKERKAILPPKVYQELKSIAGPTFLWETFPDELRRRLLAKGLPSHRVSEAFSPDRLKWWLQDEIDDYRKECPETRHFTAHDFRRRAMTEAWRLGVPVEKAAIAFACNVRTMMTHYVALDETEVTDEVLTLIAKEVGSDGRGTKENAALSDSSQAA